MTFYHLTHKISHNLDSFHSLTYDYKKGETNYVMYFLYDCQS